MLFRSVLVGHQYMEAVPTVLNTCFQDRKGQHDLMEILIPHNSLLHCSEGIFGAGKKDKRKDGLRFRNFFPSTEGQGPKIRRVNTACTQSTSDGSLSFPGQFQRQLASVLGGSTVIWFRP